MSTLDKTKRGGSVTPSVSHPDTYQYSNSQKALASWAVVSVIAFIASAVRRLIPVALEPVLKGDLTLPQGIIYCIWLATMVYIEGYKSFHLKFSPLVVKRSFLLTQEPSLWKSIFAGPYAMGLVGANQKRTIVSWGIVGGVMVLVKLVKLLEYPWRGIVDAGVVGGLSFGMLSILWLFLQGIFAGRIPDVDPCLPVTSSGSSGSGCNSTGSSGGGCNSTGSSGGGGGSHID